MALEAAALNARQPAAPLPFGVLRADDGLSMSILPALEALVAGTQRGDSAPLLAARFHETIAHMLADAAGQACESARIPVVALSGGCFANRLLLTRVNELLEAQGLRVLTHRRVPAGDGGLSLGQAYVAMWRLDAGEVD